MSTVEALNQLLNSEDAAARAAIEQNRAIQEQAAYRLQEQNSLINLRNRGAINTVRPMMESSQEAAIRRAYRAADWAQQHEVLARQLNRGSIGGGLPTTNPTGAGGIPGSPPGGAPSPTIGSSPLAVPTAPIASRFAGLRGLVQGLSAEAGLGLLQAGYSYLEPYNPVPRGYRAAMGDPFASANGINDFFQRELEDPGNLLRNLQRAFFGEPQLTPDPRNLNPSRSPLPITPFQGGQMQGIVYGAVINVNVRYYDNVLGIERVFEPVAFSLEGIGPISFIGFQAVGAHGLKLVMVGAGGVDEAAIIPDDPRFINQQKSINFISVVRPDGQPDTGGNPTPVIDPTAPSRPPVAAPSAPFSPATPSTVPNAVPLNNPRVITPEGTRPLPVNAPAPNPFASPAAAPDPTPSPRALPSPGPGSAPAEPAANRNPANPASQTFRSPPMAEGRLSQEARYGESFGDYLNRSTTPVDQLHNLNQDRTPGLLPATIMGATLLGGLVLRGRSTSTTTIPGSGTGTGTGTGETPTPFCRFHDDPFSPQINARTAEMRGIEIAIQSYQQTMLAKLDEKLGPQIPGGGIAGKLGQMGRLASKTWNFLQVDRVLAVLSWVGILHNAFMLSNNIGQTLFSAISSGLDAIGIQKTDENGNEEPYDVGQIVGQFTDNYAKGIFGVDNWTNMKKEWKKLNRIYQSAANLLYSIQSITFSMTEMLEVISNYTGRIGNALKRSGTILQNSFGWMNPSANYTNNRFFNALNNAQEAAEVVEQITSNVVDIQQQSADLADRKSEFEQLMSDQTKAVEDREKASATASIRPNTPISSSDERKAEL